ncbi:hypothetical protein PanWU01x14_032880, partial [Parasponia andersonii]
TAATPSSRFIILVVHVSSSNWGAVVRIDHLVRPRCTER